MFKYFFRDVAISMRMRAIFITILALVMLVFGVGQFYFNRAADLFQSSYLSATTQMSALMDFSVRYGEFGNALQDLRSATVIEQSRNREIVNSELRLLKESLQVYISLQDEADVESIALAKGIEAKLASYDSIIADRIIPSLISGNARAITEIFMGEISELSEYVIRNIASLMELRTIHAQEDIVAISDIHTMSMGLQIAVLIVTVAAGFTMAFALIKSIIEPLKKLTDAAEQLAKGELNINISTNARDDIGALSRRFMQVADTISDIIKSMDTMAQEHDRGDIDHFIDANHFEGSYRKVAEGVNKMVLSHIDIKKRVMGCVNDIGHGDFSANIAKLPGKKIFLNNILDNLRTNISGVSNEISDLINAATRGDLSKRIDIDEYSGDWAVLMKDLNKFIDAVVNPINEVSQVISQMAQGDMSGRMTGDYKGAFKDLKDNTNSTLSNVNSYIVEIADVLGKLADKDFEQSITREYVGEFNEIKLATNSIIGQLNDVMTRISSATMQIEHGAKQIADSSADLASGAERQSMSLSELSEIALSIHEKTNASAENAKSADGLSNQSKDNAAVGSSEMKRMLDAMDNIKTSSNNINNIIKVIEDIAFQTNLLALNAAVEAARAGVHGKGFAVVAEEVRSLAERSSMAAKETTSMINDSLQRVSEGTEIAAATSVALEKIVGNVTQVSGIISEISSSADEQAKDIAEINLRLTRISDVIHTTNAASEENAAASEEFSSQSAVLTSMLSEFVLRRD